ncbi:MAG: hypothetical protein ACHQFW_09250, partial [Chitinophagales bacterium]
MKTLVPSLIVIFTLNAVYCQQPFPTFNDNPHWNVDETFYTLESEVVQYGYEIDTNMCGFVYSKVFNHLFIRVEGNKVFMQSTNDCSEAEQLIYDFDLTIGEKILLDPYSGGGYDFVELMVDSIDTVDYLGVERKRLALAFDPCGGYVDTNGYAITHWIYGIGSDDHPFWPMYSECSAGEMQYYLKCFDSSAIQLYG